MADQYNEPIRIVGVDTDNVGTPRNDGTPGSGLYKVPIKLNRPPSREWAAAFPDAWNRPPSWSNMHRPGIGRVSGDHIILDGTTIEEVRDYHAATLKLVVDVLNEAYAKHQAQEQGRRAQEQAERDRHTGNVRDVADDIRFD